MRIRLSLPVLLLIASCVAAPPPPPPPARRVMPPPVAALPPPAPLASDWRDWPQTPGDWTYAQKGRGTVAAFGAVRSPVFGLSCDRVGHGLVLTVAPSATGLVIVRTSSQTRTLRVDATGEAQLPSTDPLLDALAFSRGRFTVEQSGQPPLVLPAWAEVGRVIEDCRA